MADICLPSQDNPFARVIAIQDEGLAALRDDGDSAVGGGIGAVKTRRQHLRRTDAENIRPDRIILGRPAEDARLAACQPTIARLKTPRIGGLAVVKLQRSEFGSMV